MATATAQRQCATYCVANLSYVFNHHERELAERLTGMQHHHHDLTVVSMHAHLDHDNCIESVILKGATASVRAFAEALMAERGVRHGRLNLISGDVDQGRHSHGSAPGAKAKPHMHFRPKTWASSLDEAQRNPGAPARAQTVKAFPTTASAYRWPRIPQRFIQTTVTGNKTTPSPASQ